MLDLKGYFDPVSLSRPTFFLLNEKETFSRNISIHTPDQPINAIEKHDIAIIGLPHDKGGVVQGSAKSPDQIRGMLYLLRKINNLKIYDLGNLKITENINDSYYAIRDISLELIEHNVTPVFIGGSNDLGYGVLLAMKQLQGLKQIVTIDPRLDFDITSDDAISSRNYLNMIFYQEESSSFTFCNLGHQVYYVSEKQTDLIEDEFMLGVRLGEAKNNLPSIEPYLRDADFIGIDMNAVRHSDGPGTTASSPNGFFGDEICALSRYAGMSDRLKVFGLYEVDTEKDIHDQTSHLAAQAIWYFLDGFSNKIREIPNESKAHTKKFIITLNKVEQELVFYKSTVSDRWWVEIPVKNPLTNLNYFISCAYEDYKLACNNSIPDRWWRYYHRLSVD